MHQGGGVIEEVFIDGIARHTSTMQYQARSKAMGTIAHTRDIIPGGHSGLAGTITIAAVMTHSVPAPYAYVANFCACNFRVFSPLQ